jgi:hypothetical protein
MPEKDPKAMGRHFVEALNKGKAANLAVIDELYSPDIVFHRADGTTQHGLDEVKKNSKWRSWTRFQISTLPSRIRSSRGAR